MLMVNELLKRWLLRRLEPLKWMSTNGCHHTASILVSYKIVVRRNAPDGGSYFPDRYELYINGVSKGRFWSLDMAKDAADEMREAAVLKAFGL